MNWKKLGYILYPFLVGFLLPLLILMNSWRTRDANAGQIRHVVLSPEHPLIVRLAMGRSTAISFSARPEKVVTGNPQAVEVNFLNHDLTLTPLRRNPGNLIVYTKSNRYVILLQVTNDNAYDDAVVVNTAPVLLRPLRLDQDTFTIEKVSLTDSLTRKATSLTVLVEHGGKVLESDSLPDELRCQGCMFRKHGDESQLLCGHPIHALQCRVNGARVSLMRQGAGS